VHVDGAGTSGGSPISIDLYLVAGVGGSGKISQSGLGFQIVRLRTRAYFNAGQPFWRHYAGAAVASLFKGRWIEASATSGQLASFTPITDIRELFAQILTTHGKLVLGTVSSFGGRPAFAIDDTTDGGVLYIAATGKPYPLAIRPSKARGAGLIRFDSWNGSFKITAPKNAIDYSKLKG